MSSILDFAYRHPFSLATIIAMFLAFASFKFRQLVAYCIQNVAFLFIRRTYLYTSMNDALVANLMSNGWKVKRFTGELYGESPVFIRSQNKVQHVLYKDMSANKQLFWGKGWPILISGVPLISRQDISRRYHSIAYTFRWSKTIENILDIAVEGMNDEENDTHIDKFVIKRVAGTGGRGAVFIQEKERKNNADDPNSIKREANMEQMLADPFSPFSPVKWSRDDIGQITLHNTLANMSLNNEQEDVLQEVKFWLEQRDWYEEKGIPWKRGMLFYGNPGTGKTMFARALAEHLNLPLLIFDLASMDNNELVAAWSQLMPRRIVLLEDIDAVFDKRKNVLGNNLTFDCLLNVIDGADKKQGLMVIVTTNFPEKLDYALGGAKDGEFSKGKIPPRPGRIDRVVEFKPLDRAGRIKLVHRIVDDMALAEKLVDESINDSAAQLQERAFRVATELLWKKRNNKAA